MGKVFFFKNEKDDYSGNWISVPGFGEKVSFPRGTSPVAFDLDNDGDLDLITGSEEGIVYLYRNDAIVKEEAALNVFGEE